MDKTAALKMALEWERVENLAKHGTAALSQFQHVVQEFHEVSREFINFSRFDHALRIIEVGMGVEAGLKESHACLDYQVAQDGPQRSYRFAPTPSTLSEAWDQVPQHFLNFFPDPQGQGSLRPHLAGPDVNAGLEPVLW